VKLASFLLAEVNPSAAESQADLVLPDPRAEDLDRPADEDDVADLIARTLARRGFLSVKMRGR
jgi:hypothetical protein